MDKLGNLLLDLDTCYRLKTENVENYLKLGKEDKKNLCWNTRKQLIDHINSDALKLSSIMKDVKELLKGIIIYNNIFIVIQILTFNKDPYYSGEIETVYNKN